MKRKIGFLIATLLLGQTRPVQSQVAEGIHTPANGPETICGVTASSAADFETKVRASPSAEYNNETDRYVTFVGPMPRTLWAFAKRSNFAYPVATCMRVYVEDGQTYTEREMRCDDSREDCDRAFIEFQELDNRVLGGVRD